MLLFEAVRLQLLVTMWSSTDFESLGGDEQAIDTIAWAEVEALLLEPALAEDDVRPLPVMVAAGSVALARDAADRARPCVGGRGFSARRCECVPGCELPCESCDDRGLLPRTRWPVCSRGARRAARACKPAAARLDGLTRQAMSAGLSWSRALTQGHDNGPTAAPCSVRYAPPSRNPAPQAPRRHRRRMS